MFRRFLSSLLPLIFATGLFVYSTNGQSLTGSIRGKVVDPNDAVIQAAEVIVIDSADVIRRTHTNEDGDFLIEGLGPGRYTLQVRSPGFKLFERAEIAVESRKTVTVSISLKVGDIGGVMVEGVVEPVNTDPDANASATVLKGKDIDALPDDPIELEAALQALAGPGAGPSGGEIFIDGFSGGRLPPRDTIREIRINQNPFSSEYDRLGLGRIEIFTRPGTEDWHAEAGFEFEDESFNSRNPFAVNRPPFQQRIVSAEVSGPIIKKRVSLFFDIEHASMDNNSLINARVLDSSLNESSASEGRPCAAA